MISSSAYLWKFAEDYRFENSWCVERARNEGVDRFRSLEIWHLARQGHYACQSELPRT